MSNETEKTSPWLIAFRVIFTIAVAGCILFIFSNSLEIGPESSARSQAVMRYMNAILDRIGLGPVSEHTIRKLAHFAEYCLEGLLLMLLQHPHPLAELLLGQRQGGLWVKARLPARFKAAVQALGEKVGEGGAPGRLLGEHRLPGGKAA